MGTFLYKQRSGCLAGLYDGGLEKLHRWEKVNRMQFNAVSGNSRKVGVPNDHFRNQNEDKPKEIPFHKMLTPCCKISGVPDIHTASHSVRHTTSSVLGASLGRERL